ncbi:chorismate synthase [Sporomusa termitida]|uniref:Chorismate synthase n=1 Tax=Sporomusa termitida TaxID=2377 RepID=A0A517DSJ8_9FIRM|nr:chorismate synthase [Sporomusa termitida]QDR80332.1 Chorismate synthase [Sporomusa termitida]
MLRFITAGESHGPALTTVIDGLPAGVPLDIELINRDLARRQKGFGRGGRMLIEQDKAEITAGVRFGQTMGSPVTLVIHNRDWENWQDRMAPAGSPCGPAVTAPRPGHADLTGVLKYDRQDVRDILERASARETAARVAAGAVMKQLLSAAGIQILAHVTNIGGVQAAAARPAFAALQAGVLASELSCFDTKAEAAMKAAILTAREQGDSLGGIFEVLAVGVLPGLGSHVQWDRRLDTKLAAALMSIQAIKGVEVGAGFAYAGLPGSKAHDEIYYDPARGYYRQTNNAGGLEGGMSNGETIVLRAVMKPIPTLMTPLASVDIVSKAPLQANTERSDVCAVTAAAVVGEAMAAIVLTEVLLEKFGNDNLPDLSAAISRYRQRLSGR